MTHNGHVMTVRYQEALYTIIYYKIKINIIHVCVMNHDFDLSCELRDIFLYMPFLR